MSDRMVMSVPETELCSSAFSPENRFVRTCKTGIVITFFLILEPCGVCCIHKENGNECRETDSTCDESYYF